MTITPEDIARIQAAFRERDRKMNALFDEWLAANEHRLPVRPYRVTSVSGERLVGPAMLPEHEVEFYEFCRERGL